MIWLSLSFEKSLSSLTPTALVSPSGYHYPKTYLPDPLEILFQYPNFVQRVVVTYTFNLAKVLTIFKFIKFPSLQRIIKVIFLPFFDVGKAHLTLPNSMPRSTLNMVIVSSCCLAPFSSCACVLRSSTQKRFSSITMNRAGSCSLLSRYFGNKTFTTPIKYIQESILGILPCKTVSKKLMDHDMDLKNVKLCQITNSLMKSKQANMTKSPNHQACQKQDSQREKEEGEGDTVVIPIKYIQGIYL